HFKVMVSQMKSQFGQKPVCIGITFFTLVLEFQKILKMKNAPLISIITINYRQAAVTNQLLDSLQHLSWSNFEVIVVDNSCNGDADNIISTIPHTKLIVNPINNGFAGGNNLGIKYAKGDYILLLNNDTEVEPGFIEPMVAIFEKDANTGMVSPKIKYFDTPNTIQYAGFSDINPFTLRMNAIGHKQTDSAVYNHTNKTPFAHGCAVMIPRGVINQIGLMPEEYFLYYEEHDWSFKVRKAGYSIYYQPKSVVYHKESVSVVKNSPLKTYYLNRNRILFMRKNFTAFQKIMAFIYLVLVSIPANIITRAIPGGKEHLKDYVRAITWHLHPKNLILTEK
ncbi:MAG: glycosyltransferase family 2 protein, partial [Bacteroidales bacterium]|nr:glycosyltransferase family 2 protein [Bacteroidales bacterium]